MAVFEKGERIIHSPGSEAAGSQSLSFTNNNNDECGLVQIVIGRNCPSVSSLSMMCEYKTPESILLTFKNSPMCTFLHTLKHIDAIASKFEIEKGML